MNFEVVQAIRMLDEVIGGEFAKQIQSISDGYWETLDAKHYVVITKNYNIDIITEWEPEINIL